MNYSRNAFLSGGSGNDTIITQAGVGVSIAGNSGNDYIKIETSKASCVIAYNSGDGYDTVVGFDGNDTLKVYGNYTRSTVGNDVVVKVGSGSITLKNAKNNTINISGGNLSSSADLASDLISADDTNFVNDGANLSSIVDSGAIDYSVGKLNPFENVTSLTQKSALMTFAKK